MERFGDRVNEPFSILDLDFCAVRRRVYDVINVLEGVGLVQKWNRKNSYIWAGMALMNEKIDKIKRMALLEQTNTDLVAEIVNRLSGNLERPDTSLDDLTNNSDLVEVGSESGILNHSELSNGSSVDQSSFNQSGSTAAQSATNRNLSNLTVRFIHLFFALRPINW